MKKSLPKLLILASSFLSITGMISGQKITSFSPASGPVGTLVTIEGSGFGATPAANTVFFGTVKGTVTEASPTQLKVRVPAGANYQAISVQTGGLAGFSQLPFVTSFGCGGSFTASTLSPRVNFYAGVSSSPAGTATADLNGDGKPEIITSAQDINSLVIYENTTSNNTINGGSFGLAIALESGEAPTGLAAADFNNDGKIDLVTTNFNSSSISVFENLSTGGGVLGVGSFSGKIDFATSASPTDSAKSSGIAVGDLDSDGKIDIAVANFNKNTISIFKNISSGGNLTSTSFTRLDLVNTGQFFPNIGAPVSIVIVDLDLDGRPDIVSNNSQTLSITVMRNTSSSGTLNAASFATRTTFGTSFGTTSLASGDLNGDGKPDLAIANILDGSVSVFRNATTGTTISLIRSDLTSNAYSANVTISDLTGDGKPDLIVGSRDGTAVNTANGPVAIYTNLNSSPGATLSFGAAINYATGGSTGPLSVADLDADGKPELIVPNYYLDYVGVLKNTSSSYSALVATSVFGSSSVCNDGVWKNISDPNDPSRIICSINDNGNDLGTITANLYVEPAPGSFDGHAYMARHFVVKPTTQPTGNIRVRLYFTNAEFSALQAADNSIVSASDLAITKYQGPTEDGVFNPADATSLSVIPSQSIFFGTAFGARYAEFSVNSLSEFWLHSNAIALPVDIVSFDATPSGEKVLLNWKVANEENLSGYGVEQSTDGQAFHTIGLVTATAPASGIKSYSFADAFPAALNHYRLAQKDRDGKIKYSEVRVVRFQSSIAQVRIAPHPVTEKSVISIPASKGTTVFSLFDQRGMQLRSYNFQSNGSETIRLNFEKKELPAGTYFFQVTNGKTALQHGKLVIQ